jgi:hypothetical protein
MSTSDSALYTGTTNAYVGGSPSGNDVTRVWIPFVVGLPKTTLTSATLRVVASAGGDTSVIEIEVAASAEDNASNPSTYAQLAGKTRTTARIYPATLPSSGGTEYSYDVTTIVQEILNRTGWARDNQIGMMITTIAFDSTKRDEIALTEHATYAEPKLDLVFPGFVPKGSGLI